MVNNLMNFILKNILNLIVILIALSLMSSCSPKKITHGLITDDESLKKVANKNITKSEIKEILGTPSTKGTFSDDIWYYIIHRTEEFAFYEIENVDQLVIQIKFTEDQRLNSILALYFSPK